MARPAAQISGVGELALDPLASLGVVGRRRTRACLHLWSSVGVEAVAIAEAKVGLGFGQAVALGILCNALVCMAVWLCYSARTTTDRILAIVPPITAFVAAGFEHSVANMYCVPIGIAIKNDADFTASLAGTPDLSNLTWGAFFLDNLLPVTIGNVIGGTLLVGAVYWFVYLRPKTVAPSD